MALTLKPVRWHVLDDTQQPIGGVWIDDDVLHAYAVRGGEAYEIPLDAAALRSPELAADAISAWLNSVKTYTQPPY